MILVTVFLCGAVWILATILMGLTAARAWLRAQSTLGPGPSPLALDDLAKRVGSLETKVNLLTAFRKPEGK